LKALFDKIKEKIPYRDAIAQKKLSQSEISALTERYSFTL
jgi:hypothetical protein